MITLDDLVSYIDTNILKKDVIITKKPEEINYKKINTGEIIRLTNIKPEINTFIDFSKYELKRVGIIYNDDHNKNISFFISVLVCVIDNFINLPPAYQKNHIERFVDIIKRHLKKKNNITNILYDDVYDDTQRTTINKLCDYMIYHDTIDMIRKYLNINIITLNTDLDKIIITNNNTVDIFNKNIILLQYNNTYEPVLINDKLVFTLKDFQFGFINDLQIKDKKYKINNNITDLEKLKKIYHEVFNIPVYTDEVINRFDDDSIDTSCIERESVEEITQTHNHSTKKLHTITENIQNTSENETKSDNHGIFVPNTTEIDSDTENKATEYTIPKFNTKTKKEELVKIANNLGISLVNSAGKQKTKQDLINDINSKRT